MPKIQNEMCLSDYSKYTGKKSALASNEEVEAFSSRPTPEMSIDGGKDARTTRMQEMIAA